MVGLLPAYRSGGTFAAMEHPIPQQQLPPPGWYSDPSGNGQRWWDGQSWTSYLSPAVPGATDQLADIGVTESGRRRWLLWAGPLATLVVIGIAIFALSSGGSESGDSSAAGEGSSQPEPVATQPEPSLLAPPTGDEAASYPTQPQQPPAFAALAKETAHTAQVAIETYATDHGGAYTGATPAALRRIDPVLIGKPLTVVATTTTYVISVNAGGDESYTVSHREGRSTFSCSPEGTGGCPSDGNWG